MQKLLGISLLLFSSIGFAHPNGKYEIDNDPEVQVTFKFIERCPTDVEGAMRGGLRTLTFTEKATLPPYEFVGGYYVEIHDAAGEVYIQTDADCVPLRDGLEIPASRSTFDGFPLKRLI